ncbi:MAG: hypothetical protein MR531_01305 [Lachnospiraceae bacterium]|nr:hypothetical protein [Lachnospiraceae bacterium]
MKGNNDFKYMIQDVSHIYFGKELSYAEMMELEDVPFKFKAIIGSYISKDIELTNKMIEHLYQIKPEEFSYRIYEQLKLQVRLFYKEESKGLFGKQKDKWVHKTCNMKDFLQNYKEMAKKGEATIEDISISKLALMTISI